MPTRPLSTDAILESLKAVAEAGGVVTEAARRLEIDRSTLQSRLRLAKDRGHLDPDAAAGDELALAAARAVEAISSEVVTPAVEAGAPPDEPSARREQGLRDQVSRLRQELRQARREALTEDYVREEIIGLCGYDPRPPNWLVDIKRGQRTADIPVLLASDWHYGEVVRPEEVGGMNEFNAAIFQRRVRLMVERTLDICFNHRVNTNYPGMVLQFMGDMITGIIHEDLLATNDRTDQEAILELLDILIWVIRTLRDRFGKLFVVCVCGNHGRSTARGRYKQHNLTSYEWLLYNLLARHFDGDQDISFVIPKGADAHYKAYNTRIMVTHGHLLGVRGGDGIIGAAGPLLRGRHKLKNAESAVGRDFDVLTVGHYHQFMTLPSMVCNGSLIGMSEFGHLAVRAAYAPPIQALGFVSPDWGWTTTYPVFLNEKMPTKSVDWVSAFSDVL